MAINPVFGGVYFAFGNCEVGEGSGESEDDGNNLRDDEAMCLTGNRADFLFVIRLMCVFVGFLYPLKCEVRHCNR